MPQAWKDALNAAVQAGKIPNIPLGHQTSSGSNPTYGSLDPNGPEVCSGTYQCRIPGQIWDAPAGTLGLSFDDGPLPVSSLILQNESLLTTIQSIAIRSVIRLFETEQSACNPFFHRGEHPPVLEGVPARIRDQSR